LAERKRSAFDDARTLGGAALLSALTTVRSALGPLGQARPLGDKALGFALLLAESYPDCFLDDLRPFLARTSAAQRLLVWTIDRALAQEWRTRALIGTASLPPRDRALACRQAAATVAVNQLAVRAELLDCFHDGIFWLTTGSRLLRGFLNCESQNHLLGLLLAESFEGVELFDLRDPATGHSRHSLVRLRLGERPVLLDAWSEVPMLDLGSAGRAEEHDGIPSHALLVARGLGERQGIYERAWYEAGIVVHRLPVRRPPLRLVGKGQGRGLPAPDASAWRSFLCARSHHVFGAAAEARTAYQRTLESADKGHWLRRVAELLRART
jgi:hypothetical protein